MADHMTAEQYGPDERIVRTCNACKACVSESYRCQSDSGHDVYCTHPALPERKRIGDTTWSTPDWCPVIVAHQGDASMTAMTAEQLQQLIDLARIEPRYDGELNQYVVDATADTLLMRFQHLGEAENYILGAIRQLAARLSGMAAVPEGHIAIPAVADRAMGVES